MTDLEVSRKKKGLYRAKAQIHELKMRNRSLLDKLLGR